MRHRAKRHGFGRRHGPRIALIRGLVVSLVEHGRIKTTLAKAKEARRHVEKAITVAKSEDILHSYRLLLSRYPNEKTVTTLTTDLKKRFEKRAGGYTRIIKIGARPGDQADSAYLEFVDYTPPAAGAEEVVKGDKGLKARMRKNVVAKDRHRKRVRDLQQAARRYAREINA
jgi:large subunit ribosomal protein L17